ncbi:hypothetical protein SUDANB145_00558 [Streptomyces sp. enrichment culture]
MERDHESDQDADPGDDETSTIRTRTVAGKAEPRCPERQTDDTMSAADAMRTDTPGPGAVEAQLASSRPYDSQVQRGLDMPTALLRLPTAPTMSAYQSATDTSSCGAALPGRAALCQILLVSGEVSSSVWSVAKGWRQR